MLLRAVEPLEGCQRSLLDSETPFLHVPEGGTGKSQEMGRQGSAELFWGAGPACWKKRAQEYLSPNMPPAHLPENTVSKGPPLKFPKQEAATGNRFQLSRWKNFLKCSYLKLKGVTWEE